MSQQILSISQINEYIKTVIDNDSLLANIAVCGEISNYKLYPSGHHYFTLKDDGASLKCVMFKGNAFRLRFRPENGMKVIVLGRISVYPRDGAYQLYCTNMTIDGVGDLHAAFEQLKAKLEAQGLFDPRYKKQLPAYPGTIGIITSEAGAAVHDMLRILNKRFPLVNVNLIPVRVQGVEAPGEIADAIRFANRHQLADVLIVGRGGGSIEDLWAFNDEKVAYAIFESKIPVISAVGHEPDVTISDYVADVRAATPSNAAEIVVPDQASIRQNLDGIYSGIINAYLKYIKSCRLQLKAISESAYLKSPKGYIEQHAINLESLMLRLSAAGNKLVQQKKQQHLSLAAKLDAMSPLKVLTRGYALVQKENMIVRSAAELSSGDRINIQFSSDAATAVIVDTRNEG